MEATSFETAILSWHDFFLAVASAAAALLGLLFVGVSISLSAIAGRDRAAVRRRANVAFSNLLYLLGLSLVILIPASDPGVVTISFTVIALLGLVRVARRLVPMARGREPERDRPGTLRRLGWTVAADLLLLYTAVSLASTGDPRWLLATPIVVGVLLLGAADVAWDLLVEESEDAGTERSGQVTRAGPQPADDGG